MRRAIYGIAMMVCTACFLHAAAQGDKKISPKAQERIAKEVRHQIMMLPDFGNFDNIAFNLNGYDVTLYGQVVQPLLKDTAEKVVKKIKAGDRPWGVLVLAP